MGGNVAAARLLIEAGAEVDFPMAGGDKTPLWWALYRRDQAMADLLRQAGAEATEARKPAARRR